MQTTTERVVWSDGRTGMLRPEETRPEETRPVRLTPVDRQAWVRWMRDRPDWVEPATAPGGGWERSSIAGTVLTAARALAGMTQSQAATAVGCHQWNISSWEHGRRRPGVAQVDALMALYGCDPEALQRVRTAHGGDQDGRAA